MKWRLGGIALGLVAGAAFVSTATAQQVEGVNVEASRIVKERVGTTADNLTPINAIALSYKVSYTDLDLTTSAGAKALEGRVNAAALAACKEITRLYPDANPGDTACAKKAAAEAMVKVRELVAAAGGAPKK
jgi:UrcA family protein